MSENNGTQLKSGTKKKRILGVHDDQQALEDITSPVKRLRKQHELRQKETQMDNNINALSKVKEEMVTRLLNVATMRDNNINMVEFAKDVGMTESRAYYYLNKFGFTFRDGIHNNKSSEKLWI